MSRTEALGTSETRIMKSVAVLVGTYDPQLPRFGKSHRDCAHNRVAGVTVIWYSGDLVLHARALPHHQAN